jgi:natural product precursor
MVKKKMKKLTLGKETLRHLEEPQLNVIAGGATASVCFETACPTCWDTCGRTCPCVP